MTRLRRLDPRKLSDAWMAAYQALSPEAIEALALAADKYGGFHTSLTTDGDDLIVSMAGVQVLRTPRALIELDDPREPVQ
jgi:hypothetical protein